ncbi:MAG: c-type cytochrome [Sulfuritalea sp.]|nr:c-type cytochrome [Sulfuritalea sp.]
MKNHPKRITRLFLIMAASATVSAAIAADKPVDVGKFEYEGACASCHGLTGKGNGPLAMQMSIRTPDLTGLAKANNGVFPFDRVFQVIDGRQEVKAHGPRDMPVWGRAFNRQSSAFFENYPHTTANPLPGVCILALPNISIASRENNLQEASLERTGGDCELGCLKACRPATAI